ncbi:DNA glycosylase [Rostrohypoxylon terebratum]|nr:DNA glycosylase [Rostrohypoxylon terebratum]
MPRRNRKGPKSRATVMLPHGLGVVLGAKETKALLAVEDSSVSNSLPVTKTITDADSIATFHQSLSTPKAQEVETAATPTTSKKDDVMAVEYPTLASLGTAAGGTALGSGRQLRPRKPKTIPQGSPTQTIISFPIVKFQPSERKVELDDGKVPEKRKAQTENTPDTNGEEPHTDILRPKAKRMRRAAKKTKDNPYGLTPGVSPFPSWSPPNAEQCEEVFNLLSEMHDNVMTQSPEVIPPPSLEVTGCGEVPSLLDGLLRTYLSTAVSMDGSNRMLQNIAEKFGVLKGGIGDGSVDWNKVRLSPTQDLYDAIRQGGLATEKSKNIKAILDMVYQENVERRDAYLEERKTGLQANVFAAANKTDGQKDFEIQAVEQNILSLEHLRGLPKDDVMKHLNKYPGIGVKTSACVILFCLRIPCFAVDTHVHRFARWLGWVPENANADDTFSHLEVRCPDDFKYGLHQLFIQHGKLCGKCKANTAEGTKDWDILDECLLESLLRRFGKRQAKTKAQRVLNNGVNGVHGVEGEGEGEGM